MIAFRGSPVETVGDLPPVGTVAPDSPLTDTGLRPVRLSDVRGHRVVLSIFPSIDTPVCGAAVREFNRRVIDLPDDVLAWHVSADLPFAQTRFCTVEGCDRIRSASAYRGSFGDDYGVRMTTGPLPGLLARAVLVLDEEGVIRYRELVPDIADEPDYDAAVAAIRD